MPPITDAVIRAAPSMRVKFMNLSPCLQRHVDLHILAVAFHDDHYNVADLLRLQRISEVVKILDLFSIEFDEQISLLQTGLRGRTIVLNVCEKHTFQVVSKIRY